MLGFDPEARMLTFRTTLDGPRVELAFLSFSLPCDAHETRAAHGRARHQGSGSPESATHVALRTSPRRRPAHRGHFKSDGVPVHRSTTEAARSAIFVPRFLHPASSFRRREIAKSPWMLARRPLEALDRQQKSPSAARYSLLELWLLPHDQSTGARRPPANSRSQMLIAGMPARLSATALAHKMGTVGRPECYPGRPRASPSCRSVAVCTARCPSCCKGQSYVRRQASRCREDAVAAVPRLASRSCRSSPPPLSL